MYIECKLTPQNNIIYRPIALEYAILSLVLGKSWLRDGQSIHTD